MARHREAAQRLAVAIQLLKIGLPRPAKKRWARNDSIKIIISFFKSPPEKERFLI